MSHQHVIDPFAARRRVTREVRVGDVGIGGDNPIRIQSMTNTDTMDTRATVDQIERMAAAGCEIARVTAPSIRDAENLREIRDQLRGRGVDLPLVADIHFTPNAAMIAAQYVEKVRVNPGNYADKKKFEVREYDDAEYAAELERVAERFRPLVRRCKQNGVAMRIGTNHGSLSDRIMNRHGDSPLGMVESALEFLDVCEDEGHLDVVFSMKASNTHVAIQAYRLLVARLAARGGDEPSYPLHLGVTEAGDGEDGRIKSAIGIGGLLEEGIGDTIRVSLTEDPVRELPVARLIAERAERIWAEDRERPSAVPEALASGGPGFDPFAYARRATQRLEAGGLSIGNEEPIRVELDAGTADAGATARATELAASLGRLKDIACEGLLLRVDDEAAYAHLGSLQEGLREAGLKLPLAARLPAALLNDGLGVPAGVSRVVVPIDARDSFGLLRSCATGVAASDAGLEWCLQGDLHTLPELVDRSLQAAGDELRGRLAYSCESPRANAAVRLLAASLSAGAAAELPIVLRHERDRRASDESALVDAAVDLGVPLVDGLGDAVSLAGFEDEAAAVDLAYRVLQGARLRTTRTEYISCPSCGRTLFDLEETTARIKAATDHLVGVKIAIMGCIVNGPGEMADADFGYVGSGPGVVTLYVGKQIVARSIPEAEAPGRLVELIREHGSWHEDGAAG